MTHKNWRWGMVGCGDVTERKSGPAYRIAAGSELVAVYSRRADKAADYARRHGVDHWHDDLDALLANDAVDAVYIATPPAAHPDIARQVAAAGKPCCIEKPLANSLEEAEAIADAFSSRGLPLFVAFYRRSLPRFRQVAGWIETGRIGAVRHVHWSLTRAPNSADLSGADNWRTDPDVAPGGYFDDLACHGLDLFDHLIGPLSNVHGQALHQHQLYKAPSAFSANWQHANGATGTGVWNFAAAGREDQVRILGSHGEIRFSVFEDEPVILQAEDETLSQLVDNPDPVQLPHVEAMIAHLNGGPAHPSLAANALRTVRAVDAIRGVPGNG
ncbi:oxidoreductase [Maricaulis sp. W15]|uniref:Gfo/Idh/MocA family protein n=1 Tax=Maricaulis sp. W15 TaxID=1772333 RepID=UPI0009490886|nr:Gfo/Idh/MocA family oxidoreductase [Maricaulis sp. W15]OLF75415.1 oxidoreductase [Maricaulis sp. W15]